VKYRVTMHVEAASVDEAASVVADVLNAAGPLADAVTGATTHDQTSPILHFAG
jgi:hypothetical protein